jgi:hypothetical protein
VQQLREAIRSPGSFSSFAILTALSVVLAFIITPVASPVTIRLQTLRTYIHSDSFPTLKEHFYLGLIDRMVS